MPLQEFLVDLQEDWPLQEFTPVHFTLASSALAVLTAKVPNSNAAAVAIATPPAFVVFMLLAPYRGDGNRIIAPLGATQVAEIAHLPTKTGDPVPVLQQNTGLRIQL